MHLWYLAILGILVGSATGKLQIPPESQESDLDVPTVIEQPPVTESSHQQRGSDRDSEENGLNSDEVNQEFEEFDESSSEEIPGQKEDSDPNEPLENDEKNESSEKEPEINPIKEEAVEENSGEGKKESIDQLENSEEIEEEPEVEDHSSEEEEETPNKNPSNADETKNEDSKEKLASSEEIEEEPEIEENSQEEEKNSNDERQEVPENDAEVEEEPEIPGESEEQEDGSVQNNVETRPEEEKSERTEEKVDAVNEETPEDSEEIEEENELEDNHIDDEEEKKEPNTEKEITVNQDQLDHSEEIEEENELEDKSNEEMKEDKAEASADEESERPMDGETKEDTVAETETEQANDGEEIDTVNEPKEVNLPEEAQDVNNGDEEKAEEPALIENAQPIEGGDLESEINPEQLPVERGSVERIDLDVCQKIIEEAENAFAAFMKKQKNEEQEQPASEGTITESEQVVFNEVDGAKEDTIESNEETAATEPVTSQENEASAPVTEEKPSLTHAEIRAAIISEAENAFKTVIQNRAKKDEAEELRAEPKLDESEEKEISKLMTNPFEQKEEAMVETAEKVEEESIVRDIRKRSSGSDDPTVQPAGASPIELPIETKDTTGKNDTLPASIAKDFPKTETNRQDLAVKKFTDHRGWIHYPWKMFPLIKKRFHREKHCGCQVMWIKRVYTRPRPKSNLVLVHSSSITLNRPRRRPCNRRRSMRKTVVPFVHKFHGKKCIGKRVAGLIWRNHRHHKRSASVGGRRAQVARLGGFRATKNRRLPSRISHRHSKGKKIVH